MLKKFTGTCWKNTGESLKGLIVAIFGTIIKWITTAGDYNTLTKNTKIKKNVSPNCYFKNKQQKDRGEKAKFLTREW